jgi:2-dehydropantoate 2-reductase
MEGREATHTFVQKEKKSTMRVGIIGAGAMGTFFAYTLAQRQEVTLLDVRADIIETIASKGVAVDDAPPRRVTATRDPAALYAVNALFVFVKAQDTLRALRPFAGRLDPSAPIVSLQNGLGNEEAIKTALGGAVPLVLGVTSEGSVTVSPGRSRRTASGATVLGSAGASPTAVHSVETMLEAGNLSASVVYDIRPHLWGKLIANAAINPVAALLDQTNGIISRDRDAAEVARMLALEGAAVAKALRISLPFAEPWEYVREIVEATAEANNSMTCDLNAQRQTEIEQINGAIVAAGRRTETPTPYNEAMLRLIKAKERAAEEDF